MPRVATRRVAERRPCQRACGLMPRCRLPLENRCFHLPHNRAYRRTDPVLRLISRPCPQSRSTPALPRPKVVDVSACGQEAALEALHSCVAGARSFLAATHLPQFLASYSGESLVCSLLGISHDASWLSAQRGLLWKKYALAAGEVRTVKTRVCSYSSTARTLAWRVPVPRTCTSDA